MNPRQRRGVLLLGVAALGFVGVFAAVSSYVGEVTSRVGPSITGLHLTRDVSAYEAVGDAFAPVELPQRWAPGPTLTDASQVGDLVAGVDLPAGTLLQAGMLVEAPRVEAGQREMTVLVEPDMGAAEQMSPNSLVDIVTTFQTGQELPVARVLIDGARVLAAGDSVVAPPEDDELGRGGGIPTDAVPVTFALSIDDSVRLAYAQSFGTAIRMVQRSPLDTAEVPEAGSVYEPVRPYGEDGV